MTARSKAWVCGLKLIPVAARSKAWVCGLKLIPVAVRSKAWVCGRSLAGIMGSNPAGDVDVCRECCVLSGRGLCDGADPLSRGVLPRTSVSLSVVRRNRNPVRLQCVGGRSSQ